MMKLVLGSMAIVGVLGFAACSENNPKPNPETLADCPASITVVSGNLYSVPNCQLKVGSSVTVEASGSHPLIAKGSTSLVSSTQTSSVSYTAKTEDVGKTLEYQCQFHNPSMSGSIKVVAAM